MQMIDRFEARKILRNAGLSENLIDTIALNYIIPKNIVDYAITLWKKGMRDEQILTIIGNSTATMEILNVRKFFREIGPLALRIGFTPVQIENDIREFDNDMEKYAHEFIGIRAVHDIQQSPVMMIKGIDELVNMCAVGHGKYYRAGIEFIEWARRYNKPKEHIQAILNRCIEPGGFNIKRLLRLTTDAGRNTVSRANGQTIKPHIRMRNMKYAQEVYQFFAENTDKIRQIAEKYSDRDLINALYKLCANWDGWSWPIAPIDIDLPEHRIMLRDAIIIVMHTITADLPYDVRKMMKNIAEHEFARLVPAAEYESVWTKLVNMKKIKR